MNTQYSFASHSDRALWAKLHGAEPLLAAVVNTKVVEPRCDVLRESDVPKFAHVLLEGHTYRYSYWPTVADRSLRF